MKSISKKVDNYNKLTDLGLDLGIDDTEIKKARTNNPKNIEGAAYDVLIQWFNGDKNIGVLENALHACNMSACVASFLMEDDESEAEDQEEFEDARDDVQSEDNTMDNSLTEELEDTELSPQEPDNGVSQEDTQPNRNDSNDLQDGGLNPEELDTQQIVEQSVGNCASNQQLMGAGPPSENMAPGTTYCPSTSEQITSEHGNSPTESHDGKLPREMFNPQSDNIPPPVQGDASDHDPSITNDGDDSHHVECDMDHTSVKYVHETQF